MNELLKAAKAVCDRWESPNWSDDTHTRDYIHRLRDAIINTTEIQHLSLANETLKGLNIEAIERVKALGAISEPVAWAIFLSNELVDLAMIEPEFSHDYTSKPLYTAPPNIEALIAEIEELKIVPFLRYPSSRRWSEYYSVLGIKAILDKYRGEK